MSAALAAEPERRAEALPRAVAEAYPFAPRALALPEGRLAYVDEGPRAADPLLFVHGNPTWSFVWRRHLQAFAGERRAVAVDHLGCGLSDKPAAARYTLAAHAQRLRALVRELDLHRITLVLHDWGGPIGLALLRDEPERIARVALLNTAAFFLDRGPLRIRACRWPLVGPWLVTRLNSFVAALPSMGSARPGGLDPVARAGLAWPYRRAADRVAIAGFVRDIPLEREHPSRAELLSIERALPALRARPLALIWGLRDFCFTPAYLEEWRRRFPQAALHAFPGAGHLVMEDEPAGVEAALRALEQRPAP